MYNKKYKEAFTEANSILKLLNQEDYKKIPKNVIEAIKQNQNKEYEFKLDPNKDIKKQNIMEETRAILYNIFRDYLATPEQRQEIIKSQREERYHVELKKKQKYGLDVFSNKKVNRFV